MVITRTKLQRDVGYFDRKPEFANHPSHCIFCDKPDRNGKPPASADFPTARKKDEIMK